MGPMLLNEAYLCKLEGAEWHYLFDLLNGHLTNFRMEPLHQELTLLIKADMSSGEGDQLHVKWEVDPTSLLNKLWSFKPVQIVAILTAIDVFWGRGVTPDDLTVLLERASRRS